MDVDMWMDVQLDDPKTQRSTHGIIVMSQMFEDLHWDILRSWIKNGRVCGLLEVPCGSEVI